MGRIGHIEWMGYMGDRQRMRRGAPCGCPVHDNCAAYFVALVGALLDDSQLSCTDRKKHKEHIIFAYFKILYLIEESQKSLHLFRHALNTECGCTDWH